MKNNGGEVFLFDLLAPALKLHKSEAKEGVMRLVGLLSRLRRVYDFGSRGAVVCIVEISVLVKHLAVQNADGLATPCVQGKLDCTRHLLTEVKHAFALRRGDDFLYRNTLDFPCRHTLKRDKH